MTLTGSDYLELLPVKWRAINDYGIRIDHRTYDSRDLGPWRRQHSGLTGKRGLWEVHYDPYDLSQVFLRTPEGWVTAPWTHRAMVTAPFADFTWRRARRLVAESGRDVTETEIARALDVLLNRAEHGLDTAGARVAARTRAAARAHRPGRTASLEVVDEPAPPADPPAAQAAPVIPFGVFDADAEAERWLWPPSRPAWTTSSRSLPMSH